MIITYVARSPQVWNTVFLHCQAGLKSSTRNSFETIPKRKDTNKILDLIARFERTRVNMLKILPLQLDVGSTAPQHFRNVIQIAGHGSHLEAPKGHGVAYWQSQVIVHFLHEVEVQRALLFDEYISSHRKNNDGRLNLYPLGNKSFFGIPTQL